MASVKIWPINQSAGVRNSVKYIANKEKSTNKTESELDRSTGYISDGSKTFQGELVYGYLCTPETASEDFELIKEINLANVGKTREDDTGATALHYVVSFAADDDITPEEALEFGKELIKKLGNHQAVIAVHTNTDNLHIHTIFNSHTSNPIEDYGKITKMKYDRKDSSYLELREYVNEMCRERGLSVIEQNDSRGVSWREAKDAKKENPVMFKNIIKKSISEAIYTSNSWSEFKNTLKDKGIEVNERGNTVSYKLENKDMNQFIRARRLGNQYEKEEIINAINNPKKKDKDVIDYQNDIGYNIETTKPYYSNKEFNKKGRKPYMVRTTTLAGRKKSHIDIIIALAKNVISRRRHESTNQKSSLQMDYKLQELVNSVSIARKYQVEANSDIDKKLSFSGRSISNIRKQINSINKAISNREGILKQINDYKSSDNEENKNLIIKELYKKGIKNDEDISEFINKDKELKDNLEVLSKDLKSYNEEYRDLKKLQNTLEKSQSKDFVLAEEHHIDLQDKDQIKKVR